MCRAGCLEEGALQRAQKGERLGGWQGGGQGVDQPVGLGLSWKNLPQQGGLCWVRFRASVLGAGWWPLCVGWQGLVAAGRRGQWWGGQTQMLPTGNWAPPLTHEDSCPHVPPRVQMPHPVPAHCWGREPHRPHTVAQEEAGLCAGDRCPELTAGSWWPRPGLRFGSAWHRTGLSPGVPCTPSVR